MNYCPICGSRTVWNCDYDGEDVDVVSVYSCECGEVFQKLDWGTIIRVGDVDGY